MDWSQAPQPRAQRSALLSSFAPPRRDQLAMDAPITPRLPPELERVIFELTARNSRREALPTLMLVACRVRNWMRPILFESVIINTIQGYRPLYHNRCPPYPKDQELHYVKRLLMIFGYPRQNNEREPDIVPDCKNYISQCPNLQDFALWCNAPSNLLSQLNTALNSPCRTVAPPKAGLLRLSLELRDLFPDGKSDFTHGVFRDLTHLEVLDDGDDITWEEGNNYACLPKLRYLAFALVPTDIEVVLRCLEECRHLRVLIISEVQEPHDNYNRLVELSQMNDERRGEGGMVHFPVDMPVSARDLRGYRIVINPDQSSVDYANSWLEGGDEGDIMWTYAEELVNKRLGRR